MLFFGVCVCVFICLVFQIFILPKPKNADDDDDDVTRGRGRVLYNVTSHNNPRRRLAAQPLASRSTSSVLLGGLPAHGCNRTT